MTLPSLASIASFVAALAAFTTSVRNAHKIQEVHLSVNSRLDELLAATKASSFAEGKASGKKKQKK